MYKTKCPHCGEPLFVEVINVLQEIPLHEEGYDESEAARSVGVVAPTVACAAGHLFELFELEELEEPGEEVTT